MSSGCGDEIEPGDARASDEMRTPSSRAPVPPDGQPDGRGQLDGQPDPQSGAPRSVPDLRVEQGEGAEPTSPLPDDPWALPQQFPTSLIGLWPLPTAPKPHQVAHALAAYLGESFETLDEVEPEDAAIEWSRVLAVPGLSHPVIVWAEPAQAMGPDDLPRPDLASARWVLGCESLLSDETPLDDFIALMRLLAGSFSEIEAVLDTTTRQWFGRDELEALFLADEPAATEEVLWRVHAVGRAERIEDDERVWLYTVGLWRCGKPELEILELPGRSVGTAITLMNGIAALALAGPLPRPDVTVAIGENLRVTFRPWQEVAEFLDPESVGSVSDRRQSDERGVVNPLTGVRAVICDAEPKGTFRTIWTWPERAIGLMEDGRGAIFLSERSTEQLARRARATWPDFATAYAAIERAIEAILSRGTQAESAADPEGNPARPSSETPAFLVKAGFSHQADPDRGREHLWFEVRRFRGDSVEAELLNTPQIATHLRRGDLVRIERGGVSDWRAILPDGGYGPDSSVALLGAVDAFRAELQARRDAPPAEPDRS